MSAIKTYSGVMFDPINVNAELICIEDIAHALSFICRANGHFKSFYSVGQHCLNCAMEAKERGYSLRVQLGCLLHDGSEAYLSDVTRPVKKAMPEYLKIEEPLQTAIWDKWITPRLTQEEIEQIFEIDDAILINEFWVLMDTRLQNSIPLISSTVSYDFEDFSVVENNYLSLFMTLKASI